MSVSDIGDVVDVNGVLDGLLRDTEIEEVEVTRRPIVLEDSRKTTNRRVAMNLDGLSDLDALCRRNDDCHIES
jgi:hypothetical protein